MSQADTHFASTMAAAEMASDLPDPGNRQLPPGPPSATCRRDEDEFALMRWADDGGQNIDWA